MALKQCKSLKERNSYLLDTGHLSDVTFIVGKSDKKETFKAHKIMLAAESEVFESMFYGSSPETSSKISVPDLEPDAFKTMLRYLYLDDRNFSSDEELALSTLRVAHKYKLRHLLELCAWIVMNNISVNNVCTVLQIAHECDVSKLKMAATYYICKNTQEVVELLCSPLAQEESLKQIACQDYLNIPEYKFISAIVNWAGERCKEEGKDQTWENIGEMSMSVVPHLRFTSLTAKKFAMLNLDRKMLEESECYRILMNIVTPGCKRLPDWCSQKRKRMPFEAIRFDWINIPNKQTGSTLSGLNGPVDTLYVKTKFHLATDSAIIDSLIWEDSDNLPVFLGYLNKSNSSCDGDYSQDEDNSGSVSCGSDNPESEGEAYITENDPGDSITGELMVHNASHDLKFRHTVEVILDEDDSRLEINLDTPLLVCKDEIYEISLVLKVQGVVASSTIDPKDVVKKTEHINFYKNDWKTPAENRFHKLKLFALFSEKEDEDLLKSKVARMS